MNNVLKFERGLGHGVDPVLVAIGDMETWDLRDAVAAEAAVEPRHLVVHDGVARPPARSVARGVGRSAAGAAGTEQRSAR